MARTDEPANVGVETRPPEPHEELRAGRPDALVSDPVVCVALVVLGKAHSVASTETFGLPITRSAMDMVREARAQAVEEEMAKGTWKQIAELRAAKKTVPDAIG